MASIFFIAAAAVRNVANPTARPASRFTTPGGTI